LLERNYHFLVTRYYGFDACHAGSRQRTAAFTVIAGRPKANMGPKGMLLHAISWCDACFAVLIGEGYQEIATSLRSSQ